MVELTQLQVRQLQEVHIPNLEKSKPNLFVPTNLYEVDGKLRADIEEISFSDRERK